VADTPRVSFGDVSEFGELLGRDPAAGEFDANHVRIRSPNAVDAVLEANGLEDFGIEFAAPVLLDLRDKAVIFGYIFPAMIGRDWNIRDGHKSSLPTKFA
jgi:hypothetical protein